jgi:hypothetical protein
MGVVTCVMPGARRRLALPALALLGLLAASPAAAQVTPQIVNGADEFAEPTTGALLEGLDPTTAIVACSAVLVSCDIAITAGHCFNTNPSLRKWLFFQHAGFYEIQSFHQHPLFAECYASGPCQDLAISRQEDIAIVKLVKRVDGIRAAKFNTAQTPGPGTPGHVVGFGRDPLDEPSSSQQSMGIKRSGSIELAACQHSSLAPYDVLCWDPSEVLGDPGEDVSTCNVDSGGPLFVDQNGVRVVAGLTKGAIMPMASCIPPVEPFDTNVFRHHDWIEFMGEALSPLPFPFAACGWLPWLDDSAMEGVCDDFMWEPGEAPRVCGFQGQLGSTLLQQLHSFQVPPGTQRLRVTMNGTSRLTNPVDLNLYVRAGAAPTTSVYDCAGAATGNFAVCEFWNPQAGTWYALANRVTGTVDYQITATEFGPSPVPPVPALDGAARPALAALLAGTGLALLRRTSLRSRSRLRPGPSRRT